MANSATHAALPYPIKGARFSMLVPFLDADGDPTAQTTPDTEVSKDNAAATDAAEEVSATSGMDGMGLITFTGAETDCSTLAANFKAASGPKATLATLFPRVLASVGTGTLSAGSAGGGTLGTLLAYDITGCFIKTTGGTGGGGTGGANNQARKIATYNTGTGAFTVVPNWETTPDNTTTYEVLLPEGVTLGMLKALNSTTPIQTAGDIYSYLTTNVGALGVNLSAIPKTGFKLASDGLASVVAWSVAITGNITGNLSGSVGSVTSGVTVGTNNDKTGYGLSSGERTTLAGVIWDSLTSGMSTVGSIGKKLADWVVGTIDTYTGNTKQTGDAYAVVNNGTYGNSALKTLIDNLPTAAGITTAVWAAGTRTLTSFGSLASDTATAVWAAGTRTLTSVGTLVADIWSHATRLLTAGTNIALAKGTGVTGFNDLSAAQVNAEADQALADYAGPTNAQMEARTLLAAEYGTAANQTTILNRIGAFTGTGINSILGFLRALGRKTAALTPSDMGGTYDNTTDSLEAQADTAGGSAPTVQQIVDGVWNAPIADHLDTGSTGKKLNDAGAAGDPWATDLEAGNYSGNEAGAILYNNLDAQVSELLGSTISQPRFTEDCGEVQSFDAGEKKPVYVSLTSTGGSFTITSAKVFLQDATGAAVGTLTNVNATGFDAGALTTARAWFNLNTAVPNGSDTALEVGTYELLFVINGTGSDGIPRTHEIPVVIQVV